MQRAVTVAAYQLQIIPVQQNALVRDCLWCDMLFVMDYHAGRIQAARKASLTQSPARFCICNPAVIPRSRVIKRLRKIPRNGESSLIQKAAYAA